MNGPTAAQTTVSRRLFAHESGADPQGDVHAAATRILSKLFTRLASLVGAGGARALYERSVKVTARDFASYARATPIAPDERPGDRIVAALRDAGEPRVEEATVALVSTLLTLLATLIGERLTAQVLRTAWPDFDVTAAKEETNR
jgi:hypothetical protein